jgi:hypothetical protein
MRESEVTKQCIGYLRIRGADPHRRNVGGMIRTYKGKQRYINFGSKGESDWWMIIPDGSGRHCEIEIKSSEGWPDENQIRWMTGINEQGGIAFWVNSLNMMIRVYEHIMNGGGIEMNPDGTYGLTMKLVRRCQK